jgi:Glyoxalase-like domain
MPIRFQVTFDCAEPDAMARFWSQALGYDLEPPPDGFASWEEWGREVGVPEDELDDGASIVDPEERGPRMFFQRVPETKTVKNRVHLDLDVSGGMSVSLHRRREEVRAEEQRFLALGAERVGEYELADHYHVTMRDPEGNEFCLR